MDIPFDSIKKVFHASTFPLSIEAEDPFKGKSF